MNGKKYLIFAYISAEHSSLLFRYLVEAFINPGFMWYLFFFMAVVRSGLFYVWIDGDYAGTCVEEFTMELAPVENEFSDVDGDGSRDCGVAILKAADLVVDSLPGTNYSVNYYNDTLDQEKSRLILTCKDYGKSKVQVTAWQNGKPIHTCEVNLTVTDDRYNLCECRENPIISGLIFTKNNQYLSGVEVVVTGEIEEFAITDKGNYSFSFASNGIDHIIQPRYNKDPLNGITTFDLILISQHILTGDRLESPYSLIAADVNNSKSITVMDLIQLRKLILGIEESFVNNTSWRFIESTYEFPNPNDPWLENFPERTILKKLEGSRSDLNFIGVKIGDVNNDAKIDLVK